MDWQKDWMQIGIAVFVSGMLAYLVIMDGDEEMKFFFSGIFATKIVDFIYKAATKNHDRQRV